MNYFLQTQGWMDFWLDYNKLDHAVYFFEEGDLSCYVQEYPWHLGTKFWYIPKAPVFTQKINTHNVAATPVSPLSAANTQSTIDNLDNLYTQIIKMAKNRDIIFIKNDFDDALTTSLHIENNSQLDTFLGTLPSIQGLKIISNTKKIQYLECTYCDIDYTPKNDLATDTLLQFWDNNQPFWSKCNEQVRRYTRKILKDYNQGLFTINQDKTDENFEAFWSVHQDTTLRQNFSTQPKDYLRQFMDADFGRIITVRDKDNQPMSVWLGVKMGDTLYYILGGNSDIALKSRTQYLLQLSAIQLARLENCKYYDMGGYEAGSGYGQFKDGYKGTLRQFLGPIDIVLNPLKYQAINLAYNTAKSVKSLKNLIKK